MTGLRELLEIAIRRANVSREVNAARVILVADKCVSARLPAGRRDDAKAVALQDGCLLVDCRHAAASQLITRLAPAILDEIKKSLPQCPVQTLRTRIVLY